MSGPSQIQRPASGDLALGARRSGLDAEHSSKRGETGFSKLALRVLTGALLLIGLWASLVLAPAWVFHCVALVGIGIACWECLDIFESGGSQPVKWLGLIGSLAVVASFAFDLIAVRVPLVLTVILAPIAVMSRRGEPRELLDATIKTLFPVFFVALTLGCLVELYALEGRTGAHLLLLLFLCVVLADSLAYFGGSTFGRHKMAPRLSPKKTWEGAAAGIVGSLIGAFLARAWVLPQLAVHHVVILGLLIAVAGIFGDLAESMVKRANGVKDSSNLLPGHGGMLDRTDSLLFAGPVLYFYYTLVVLGGP